MTARGAARTGRRASGTRAARAVLARDVPGVLPASRRVRAARAGRAFPAAAAIGAGRWLVGDRVQPGTRLAASRGRVISGQRPDPDAEAELGREDALEVRVASAGR